MENENLLQIFHTVHASFFFFVPFRFFFAESTYMYDEFQFHARFLRELLSI